MKKSNLFEPMGSFPEIKVTPQDEAKEEVAGMIEYSVVLVKLKGEKSPKTFNLDTDPKLRNEILALIINSYES